MQSQILVILILLFELWTSVLSANIFYMYPVGCKSTSSFHHSVLKVLINHGHKVTTLSSYPLNVTNHIDVGLDNELFKFSDSISVTDETFGLYKDLKASLDVQLYNCKKIYAAKKIKNLIKNSKFDLVMIESGDADCLLPLAFSFRAPVIGITSSTIIYHDTDGLIGNPINPSYIPTLMSGFSSKMNFKQRISNSLQYIMYWLFRISYSYKMNSVIPDYLRSNFTIDELLQNVALAFINSHPSFISRPLAINTISIVGIHISNDSHLPHDIKNFIEAAEYGVIYISLGSIVKFSSFPKQLHEDFVEVFKNLPYRIIWRHDKPEMVDASENIMVKYWLPQNEILAHEKVKLFISHGGLLSTYEAIYHGVPILSFPVFYDQYTNAAVLESLEIGIFMDLKTLTKNLLLKKIIEVSTNQKYWKNSKKLSTIFKDNIISPKDKVIYWVDYVLRHKNITFMKSFGTKLPFYSYLLLDVLLFFSCSVFYIFWISKLFIKIIRNVMS